MIIRLALLLVLIAIANFLLASAFDHLAITNYAEQASHFGAITLLCAFFMLLLGGLSLVGKLITASFCGYFSARQRMERRLLFYISRRNRLNQLFYFKKTRLLYLNQQQRKHLLKKHDRKPVAP